jgi:hypothetical protein
MVNDLTLEPDTGEETALFKAAWCMPEKATCRTLNKIPVEFYMIIIVWILVLVNALFVVVG